MKGLTGYLKKILLISSILVFSSFFTSEVKAQEFTVYADYHHVWDGNTLDSTIYLTMTTQNSPVVVTFYTITIPDEEVTPLVFSINRNTYLEPTIHRKDSMTNLVIDLEKTPIYPDKPITLKLTFSKQITGDNISLLSSVKDTVSRDFSFTYPSSLGDISWSSAPITKITSKGNKIEVLTAPPNTDTVTVSLGKSVTYTYQISKSLLNMSEAMITSEVTLPLNNNTQQISVTSIEPIPDKAFKDIDGNYILQYRIAPQSSIDVNIQGDILMTQSVYPFTQTYLIDEEKLWKIFDLSLIRHINRNLRDYGLNVSEEFADINELESKDEREILYKSIYQYVVENLEPDKLTVGSLTGAQRLGGQEALLKQAISTSEEYSDAIISLYRHYNIPARFVIGYVSDISNYHSEGMYHYWAEYLNLDTNQWVIVDPFLEDLSKTSLLNREMKDHISLIYRYSDPNVPKLPFYSKDEFVLTTSSKDATLITNFEPKLVFQPYKITDPYLIGSLEIVNTGTTILDTFNIFQSNPELPLYIDYIENNSRDIVLPGQSHSIRINIPIEEVEQNIYAVVNALSGTLQTEDKQTQIDIEIQKDYTELEILSKLLSIFLFIICAGFAYFISSKLKKNG
jgi:transglutaminase-like putative cysteine protease